MSRDPRTLERLAVEEVGKYIETTTKKFIDTDLAISNDTFEPYFESCLKLMKRRFRFAIPWDLYEQVVYKVLNAIKNLISKSKNEREEEIVSRMFKVLMNSKLKRIDIGTNMPLSLRTVFLNNMDSNTGLKEIYFDYDCETVITDDVVSNLRKCPTLRKIYIKTSAEGYAKLLLGLPYLEDLGHLCLRRCGNTGRYEIHGCGDVLELVQKSGEFEEFFQIRAVDMSGCTTEQCRLLGEMCPMISQLIVACDDCVADFNIVKTLEHLTTVTFWGFDFYDQGIVEFLESHGPKITHLYLGGTVSVDLDALMRIGQSCPNLKDFYLNDQGHDGGSSEPSVEMLFPPFKHLVELKLELCSPADIRVEFILSGCFDIEKLSLYPQVVNENTMKRVLAVNPMNKLKFLLIDSSMKTIITILRDRNSELEVKKV